MKPCHSSSTINNQHAIIAKVEHKLAEKAMAKDYQNDGYGHNHNGVGNTFSPSTDN
jgi:hypothetical protein